MERPRERRRRRVSEDGLGEPRGVVGAEGADRQLGEAASAAQLVAQAAHGVVARQPVGAVGAEHERGEVGERLGEPRHQLDRGVVAPVQVVEQQQQRAVAGRGGEDAADRLGQRRRVRGGGRRSELGQHHREVVAQRAGAVQQAGVGAHLGPQRLRERRVGRAARGVGAAAQHGQPGTGREVVGEPGLADARLADEQHHAARAAACGVEGLVEPPPLGVAADQGGAGAMRRA